MLTSIGAGVRTTVRSPIARSPCAADPRSMMTSTGSPSAAATGGCPASRCHGLTATSPSQLVAVVGGPSPPIGVPSAARICPYPSISATTVSTPSAPASVSSRSPSSRPRVAASSSPITVSLRTITSVAALASRNKRSKPSDSVSPTAREAVRNAAPRSTAVEVPTSRRLWLQRPFKMVGHMSGPQCFHPVEHPVGARRFQYVDDLPVGEKQCRVGI